MKIVPDIVNNQTVCSIPKTARVHLAAKVMADRGVGAVVVTNAEGRLEGIVTERDIAIKVVAEGLNPDNVTVEDIMTPDPDCLDPNDTALDVLEMMRSRGYRHLPVVNGNGKVVAMVSVKDLYAALYEHVK
ncbi:MAG: CBS domain-containing protein, partial [Rhodospirillales bacterium]|nr:CBS domain-containing protein [Rhodospirillales bacterium]